jgi:signal transduction histidine kinase
MSESALNTGSAPAGATTSARLLSILFIVLLALGGAFAAHRFASTLEQSQADAQTRRLNDFANADRDAVQGSLRVLEESLGGLNAYMGSATVIDTTSFDAMANAVLRRNPAVRAIGFAKARGADIAQNLATAPVVDADMPIVERNWLGALVPAAQRERYLPITRVVAIEADRFAYEGLLGLDLLSDADLASAVRSAAQAVSYQSLLPGRALLTVSKRQGEVVENTLFAEVEIASLLGALDNSPVDSSEPKNQAHPTNPALGKPNLAKGTFSQVRVYDATDRAGLRLLFPAATQNPEPPGTTSAKIARLERSQVVATTFAALGRTFRVETTPLASFFGVSGATTAMLVRLGGIGLSLLGALLAFNLLTRNARIAQLVDRRGQELTVAYEQVRDSELMSMQAEKMSSLGQMVAGVAHEINTPLAYVTSNIELLQDRLAKVTEVAEDQQHLLAQLHQWPEKSSAQRNQWYQDALQQEQSVQRLRERTLGKTGALVDESMEGLVRVRDLVSTLKDFSRVDRAAVDDVDIHQCIESTLKIAHNVTKHRANIVRDYGVLPHLRCNPSQINQVLLNLITNAAQAMEHTQDLTLGEIKISTRANAHDVDIVITDNGAGMSEATVSKIFEPFFTTKGSGQGTGLGLAICQKIIKAHNGTISVESSEGMGTIFTITLPIVGGESVFI